MKEFRTILAEFDRTDLSQRKAALATVVKVSGSSYRSPGARMLITDDGRWTGSISGGCLEGDALRKARQVMASGKPLTVTYDTHEESNQNLGIGLGCNGIIDVLIEPIETAQQNNPIETFKDFINTRQPAALATIFAVHASENASLPAQPGEKLLITPDGDTLRNFESDQVSEIIKKDLKTTFQSRKSEAKTYTIDDIQVEVFLELIQPSIELIIFGGGFDARPVSQLAKTLGWQVTVTDECVAHIAPLFFPTADNLSLCNRQFIERDFPISPYTACILMSHNYEYDRDVLRTLLKTPTPYIGILGPRKRFDKMITEFEGLQITFTATDLHRIHSPIGLDIGAETPDEIALAIISEIQSKFAARSGGYLKYRTGPIHNRDANSNQVFKQVYIGPENLSEASAG